MEGQTRTTIPAVNYEKRQERRSSEEVDRMGYTSALRRRCIDRTHRTNGKGGWVLHLTTIKVAFLKLQCANDLQAVHPTRAVVVGRARLRRVSRSSIPPLPPRKLDELHLSRRHSSRRHAFFLISHPSPINPHPTVITRVPAVQPAQCATLGPLVAFLSPLRPPSCTHRYGQQLVPHSREMPGPHTSDSMMVPFSNNCATTSSSLLVPNSASSWPLDAPSSWPWLPCL